MAVEGALAEPGRHPILSSARSAAATRWLLTLPLLAIMAIVVVFPTIFLVFSFVNCSVEVENEERLVIVRRSIIDRSRT